MLGVIPEYNANIAVVIDLEENGAYCTAAEGFQRRTVDLDNRLIIHGSNLPEAYRPTSHLRYGHAHKNAFARYQAEVRTC